MKSMRGFALLELLIIVVIIALLAVVFTGVMRPSLFSPGGTPAQVQEGNNAIQQAQKVTEQFNRAAGGMQSSTDQL